LFFFHQQVLDYRQLTRAMTGKAVSSTAAGE
jgi:hypothetical protein